MPRTLLLDLDMGKYIDAEKLIAKIERLNAIVSYESKDRHDEGLHDAYKAVKNVIDSLQQEQPEVDLEKELGQWRHKHFAGERDGHYSGEYLERSSQLDIARHFFNLGLNARKEE